MTQNDTIDSLKSKIEESISKCGITLECFTQVEPKIFLHLVKDYRDKAFLHPNMVVKLIQSNNIEDLSILADHLYNYHKLYNLVLEYTKLIKANE